MTDETFPLTIGHAVEVVEGRDDVASLILAYGTILPIQDQNGQQAVLPLGNKRFYVTRDAALDLAKRLEEVANSLRSHSSIPVAQSMSQVEAAAQRLQDLQNGR